jgi:hypothetical protein
MKQETKEAILRLMDANMTVHIAHHNPFAYKGEEYRTEFLEMVESVENLTEENKKLKFMIENGLGESDMKNDNI